MLPSSPRLLLPVLLLCVWTCRAEESPFGVTLFSPREIYRSFEEFEMKLRIDDLRAKGTPVKTAEVEIRDSARKLRLLRFPYVLEINKADGWLEQGQGSLTWLS